jgi:hypothetical protein
VLETNKTVLTSQTVLPRLEEIHRESREKRPEEMEMEWKSFRSLPRGGEWLKPAEK